MEIIRRARELREQTVAHRRWFHQSAEVGLQMPRAQVYVHQELEALGLQPRICGGGVVAELGRGGKLLLLRADMDALPIEERSGLPFACKEGRAHACGHDCHAAMLLTAAKLLQERQGELKGRVRLMFQPAEETLEGCRNMIAHGVLEPKPDAAMALHVAAGREVPGTVWYPKDRTAMLFSVENFEITVHGRGSHGAYPNLSVDPVNIAAHIHLALQALVARESDPRCPCVVTVGQFLAGDTGNVIPETAVLRGAVRSADPQNTTRLHRRVEEVCACTARAFGGTVQVRWEAQIPPLICDGDLTRSMVSYLQDWPEVRVLPGAEGNASEDFACIAACIPSTYLFLSAGFADERGRKTAHDPGVQFHEDVLPLGSAILAHCALQWLQEQQA